MVSSGINAAILLTCVVGAIPAQHVVPQTFEQTQLVFLEAPPLPSLRLPDPIRLTRLASVLHAVVQVVQPTVAPKIRVQEQPKPKAAKMQPKRALPVIRIARPAFNRQPQPKAAITAAIPAQTHQGHPSTKAVHLGDMSGVTPNPNTARPATVAAIGNPYGGINGPVVAAPGVVGSAGIGDGYRKSSNAGVAGRVASAGVTGSAGTGKAERAGKVGPAGIPAMPAPAPGARQTALEPQSTALEVLSKPPVRYTPEAKQLRVQGEVVLRVTFTADRQVVVHNVLRGLGHGLDQEAMHEAQQIKFRPATRDGHAVNLTTEIIITFQLA
ncbi:MAG TPA: energy transducer TonB [Terracidiphilus sp.]|nr:energy transducer TonB [Terracidiphilus sp.]